MLIGLTILCTGLGSARAQESQFEWMQCNGMSAEACSALMKSLKVANAEQEEVYLARASLLLQGGDLVGAIAEYREATLVNPKNATAYKNLGFLEGTGGNWKDAVTHLRSALEIDPTDFDLRPMLVVALAKNNECDVAKIELAGAKASTPLAPRLSQADAIFSDMCR